MADPRRIPLFTVAGVPAVDTNSISVQALVQAVIAGAVNPIASVPLISASGVPAGDPNSISVDELQAMVTAGTSSDQRRMPIRVNASVPSGDTNSSLLALLTGGGGVVPIVPTISSSSISGTPQVGQTLTAGIGTVTGTPTPTPSYQWRAWSAATGGTSTNLGTAATQAIATGQVGLFIDVVVTETNTAGSASATSARTVAVAAAAAALATPDLTWQSNTTTNPPLFTFGVSNLAAGDVMRLRRSAAGTSFASYDEFTHTITSGEVTAGSFTIATGGLWARQAWDVEFRQERGATVTAWSNVETKTLTLAALTLTPNTAHVGTAYTGTVSGNTSGSTITLSGTGAAGLTASGTTVSGTPTTTGPVNLIETLGAETNTTSGALTTLAAPTNLYAGFPTISRSLVGGGSQSQQVIGSTLKLSIGGYSSAFYDVTGLNSGDVYNLSFTTSSSTTPFRISNYDDGTYGTTYIDTVTGAATYTHQFTVSSGGSLRVQFNTGPSNGAVDIIFTALSLIQQV